MDLTSLLNLPPQGLVVFILVLVRAIAIFMVAPVLGNSLVPLPVKLGLAFLMTLILAPFLVHQPLHLNVQDFWAIGLAVLQETAVGLLIGFLAQLLFVSMQFAGQAVGLQMGFGLASVFDPSSQAQVSITAQLYLFVGILVFLLLNGHHYLIIALARSFQTIPLASFTLDQHALTLILRATNDMFWVALMLMAPVLGVLVLGEVSMAIVARIMPQMNMFVAAFPVKIFLGIVTMALSFPLLVSYMGASTQQSFDLIFRFLRVH